MRQLISFVLNLGMGLFLADAFVSLLDDTLIVFFDVHFLGAGRGPLSLLTLLVTLLIYGLMGLTPLVPKRWFLPLAAFGYLATLAVFPLATFFYARIQLIAWMISLYQVILGLGLYRWLTGGWRLRWPLVDDQQLGERGFSVRNLLGFVLANGLIVVPATAAYLAVCAALAVEHLSEGFLVLRTDGVTVRVREYAREGRRVRLIPMIHIGQAGFYASIAQSFPTNSIILMEGVTDNQGLITNALSYRRMAEAVGLEEQKEKFEPTQGEVVFTDLDVSQFSSNTIGFLNLVTLIQSQGLNARNLRQVMSYTPPPRFEYQLYDDLLVKRNRRVLDEIQARAAQAECIMVPWGAAHIPGMARELRRAGFQLVETREYRVIRFGAAPKPVRPR